MVAVEVDVDQAPGRLARQHAEIGRCGEVARELLLAQPQVSPARHLRSLLPQGNRNRGEPFAEKLPGCVQDVHRSGILAPAACFRAQVVPEGPDPTQPVAFHPGCRARGSRDAPSPAGPDRAPTERNRPRPRNYSWAELMRRVFLADVLECAECHGRMRILAAIHSPEAIRAILECLGLPSRAPPIAAAATDPETDGIEPDIDFDSE